MKQLILMVFATFFATGVVAQDAPEVVSLDRRDALDQTADAFLWTNRLLVIFADSELDPKFQKQLELLSERAQELIERDVVVITDTSPDAQSQWRRDLRPRGFSFVFIDKDGVVKLRKPAPWNVRAISRSIDKTILRQQEIRDQSSLSQ